MPSKLASSIRRLFPPAAPPAGEPFAWLRFFHGPIALAGVAWLVPARWPLYATVLATLTLLWPFHIELTEGVETYFPATWASAAATYILGAAALPLFWLSTALGFVLILVLDRRGLVPATGITADIVRQVRDEPSPASSGVDGNLRQFVNLSSHLIRVLTTAAVHAWWPALPLLAVPVLGEATVSAWLAVVPIPGRMAPARERARVREALGGDMLVGTALLRVVMIWLLLVAYRDGGALGFAVAGASTLTLHAILKRLNDTRIESQRQRTALIEVRSELGRRQRLAAIGDTASKVFHQIARHHGAIGMFAHLLGQEAARANGDDPARVRAAVGEHAARILQSVDEANHVIESLLRFGQDRTLNLYPQSVQTLVAECVAECQTRARPRGVQITTTIGTDATVLLDKHKIKQALGNVLDNAVDATAAGAAVDVIVGTRDDGVRIAVRDRGDGIAPDVRERLFSPFCTTKPHGVGLGLALARELVEAHGGRIAWEEAAPGTVFVLTLPGSK